jgi:DNA repair exonuclease SbcCD ATPase subunit
MISLEALTEKYRSINSDFSKISIYKNILEKNVSELNEDIENTKYKIGLYSKCSEIFKRWLEDSIEKNVKSMSELATSGLNYIIYDQDIKFKIVQEQKNNRIHMKFVLEQDGVEGDPLASYGGGAAVVVSLILRLSIMQRLGLGNLLILDESMVALANAYVPSAANFMKQLSEKTGVNILMVTHNPEFLSISHTAYEGMKTDSLKLKSIVGKRP